MHGSKKCARVLPRVQQHFTTFLALSVVLVLLSPLSEAQRDITCHIPTLAEKFSGHKAVPDITKLDVQPPTPFLETECSFFDFACKSNPCKRWGGEIDDQTKVKSDLPERVGRILKDGLVGQQIAIDTIVGALRSKRDNAPLSMHFVGDNGVGKTSAAKLIKQAILVDSNSQGILHIHGNMFVAKDSATTFKFRTDLRQMIDEKLKKCPNAIIIVDEMHSLHHHTALVFESFLDHTLAEDHIQQRRADPRGATFIFTSDFGKEGMSSEDSPEDLKRRAYEESNKVWINSRVPKLLQYIIPFVPATKSGAADLVAKYIKSLFSLPYLSKSHISLTGINFCEKDLLHQGLAEYIWREMQNGPHKKEQYRGVEKILHSTVDALFTQGISALITEKKLSSLPRDKPAAPILLDICTRGGSTLELTVRQPWCSDIVDAAKEDLKAKDAKDEM